MFTLLSECHLWTMREDIRIKSTDFGTFRYMRQREWQTTLQNDLITMAKRNYTECRNGITVLKRSRKSNGRLKENLKRLEELLRLHKVAHIHWTDATQLLLLFTNGIITHISIDAFTGDILRMVFEKYLIGKLAADTIADAFFTRSHIVLAYNTNQVTVVHLNKANERPQGPEKISNMEPKIFHAIIPGTGAERKLLRHFSVNQNGDLFLLWTKSSQNEVFPWRPTVRDQDRANIHVFKLKECQLDFFSYCWSENDPLHVDFMRSMENYIITLEQKISRKGDITAELCSYEIVTGKMQRTALSTIMLGAQITCFAFSPDQEKLFLASADKTICLHDLVLQTTKSVAQIDIISTQCSWHSDSSLIMIANTRSQFQCFDLALTPVANQLQSEDVTPINLLDLSHYFALQPPTLLHISFSKKPEFGQCFTTKYAATDSFLLLIYDNGPIGCLRLFSSAGVLGDIHNSGLTADVIIDKYLCLNQLEKAVNLLYALNWETYGAMCLISLHKITNYVLYRNDQRKVKIELLARALKTFSEALSEETKDEFSDQVFDLKRRFFFYLLRRNLFNEAFEVAQDIEDYDLFMDLHNITKGDRNLQEFATTAFKQAAIILHEEDRANGSLSIAGDYHSDSACSQSTASETVNSDSNGIGKLPQHRIQQRTFLKNYMPPLPSFKSKILNAGMIKINIPKLTELHLRNHHQHDHIVNIIDNNNQLQQQQISLPIMAETNSMQQHTTSNSSAPLAIASNLAILTVKSGATLINSNSGSSNSSSGNSNNNEVLKVGSDKWGIDNAIANNLALKSSLSNSQSHLPSTYLHMATTNTIPSDKILEVLPTYQPKFFQHPLVSGHIPPPKTTISLAAHSHSNEEYQKSLLNKRPTASILSNSQNGLANTNNNSLLTKQQQQQSQYQQQLLEMANPQNGLCKDNLKNNHGEKNKVKFSDTVQVAVVPEIPRKEKSLIMKRNGYARPHPAPSTTHTNYTNPKKELADSLPLCHPNDEYLKDFNPLSSAAKFKAIKIMEQSSNKCISNTTSKTTAIAVAPIVTVTTTAATISAGSAATTLTIQTAASSQSTIKVVHFGVV